jgi:diguanylate cyclase (GGDEF)-like protein
MHISPLKPLANLADNVAMRALHLVRQSLRLDNDALADFREGIARQIVILTAAVLLPFGLGHWAMGNYKPLVLIMLVQLLLSVNAVALLRHRRPPIPFVWMLSGAALGVSAAIYVGGTLGLMWGYPVLFISYFLLPRAQATAVSVALMVGTTSVTLFTLGWPLGLRMLATMSITLVMIHVVLNVIGDLQRALVNQAITDPLTGVYNRRHLQSYLTRLLQQSAVQPGPAPERGNALVAIDIDHFKRINDSLGHAAGDEVIRQTVALVGERKRRGDVLFRTGGEEFLVLVQDTTLPEALRLAEDMRQRIEQAPMLPGGERVTVSLGVRMQQAGDSVDGWMNGADTALYSAKREGRNRVVSADAAQAPVVGFASQPAGKSLSELAASPM